MYTFQDLWSWVMIKREINKNHQTKNNKVILARSDDDNNNNNN